MDIVKELSRKLLQVDTTISAQIKNLKRDLDILWLLIGAFLVFFMQAGFALVEAGSVRSKNTRNILLKNVLDGCVGALIWWAIGHSLAYGEGGPAQNALIGGKNFFMSDSDGGQPRYYALWLFQWAFAATSATIVSGAVAERCQFRAYLIYTTVLTGLIYPMVVHWVWSSEGWLSHYRSPVFFKSTMGLIDFAGSGVVHMVGGGASLVASIILGPRHGRFGADGAVLSIPGHSVVLASLGTLILWFGWYGFNPVSTLCMANCMYVASKIAVTTTLSAASGGATALLINILTGNPTDVSPALNGILAGLVSVSASCSVVEPYASAIIGAIGGAVYYASSTLIKRFQIDDPLDASPIHFFCGIWGVLSAGLFATPKNVKNAYGDKTDVGVFYGGSGAQLGIQLLGIVTIALWTTILSSMMFFALKQADWLRVPHMEEVQGLDLSHHDGHAYNFDNSKNLNKVNPQEPSTKSLPIAVSSSHVP